MAAKEQAPGEAAPSAEQLVKDEPQLDAAQYQEFLKWKEQQAQKGDRNPGSPKKPKIDGEELTLFKLKLNELDLSWDEMSPELRDTLRLNERAREDFLAIHARSNLQAYDPAAGCFTEEAAQSRKRDFEATTTTTPSIEGLDPRMNEAMMKYHSVSVLPNMSKLFEQCNIFYGQVLAETTHQQMNQ